MAVGAWLGDRLLKKRDHPGLRVFVHQVLVNYPASFAVEPMRLAMKVDDADLAHLQQVVDDARERGVILPEGNDYVPAVLTDATGTFKAKVRIKGKLTDHVKGSKWSFRVIAKKDGGFLGMRRFSLQHPGTRNYLYDWFYHRLMASEGVIALRYGFIQLEFNGEDLGIYAYEEHFGPELLENNGRVEGPLFRFDPGLFWQHRLNEMNELRYDEPFAAYQAANVDAFGSSEVEKDPKTRARFEEAVGLIDAFRRGELTASEVFDADRIARRHAILDLIGGHHSMDWSDVKFYYDPIARRIEPVAYESFSAFKLRTLAGSNRWKGRSEPGQDLHDQFFNDEEVFRSYVHHLERISRRSWLDSTFTALGPALDSASATVYREFPYKELDRSIYYGNQAVIRRLLDVPKPFHAYLESISKDSVAITIVPIEGLPIEVFGMVVPGGAVIPPVGKVIVPCRKPGRLGEPMRVTFALPPNTTPLDRGSITLSCSVLGASVQKSVEVFPYALFDVGSMVIKQHTGADPRTVPFLLVDDAARTITIKSGSWKLEIDVAIPSGYEVRGTAPLEIDFINGAWIRSGSLIDLRGIDGMPVRIGSSDRSGGGIMVIGAGPRSKWEHVRSSGFGPSVGGGASLVFQESPVQMENVVLQEVPERDVMNVVRGSSSFMRCSVVGGRDQLTLNYVDARIDGLGLADAGDDALTIRGGKSVMKGLVVTGAKGIGVKVSVQAEVQLDASRISASKKGLEVEGASRAIIVGGAVKSDGIGIEVRDAEMRTGPSSVEMKGTTIEGGKAKIAAGSGNDVMMDGVRLNGEPKPVKKKQAVSDT